MKKSKQQIIRLFYEVNKRLRLQMDENPRAAIESARQLIPDENLDKTNIDMIKAGVLIDAGALASDQIVVNEGIEILTKLKKKLPKHNELYYNLANGLIAQADLEKISRPDWFLITSDTRRQARWMFNYAGSSEVTPPLIAAESYTNLGNSLRLSGRQLEAYDAYSMALMIDPTNGIALTGAVKILLWYEERKIGDPRILRGVAAKHLQVARENPNRIRDLGGKQAFDSLSSLLKHEIPGGVVPDLSKASKYQQFIAKYRLALSPTLEGLDPSLPLWDSLGIHSVTESINSPEGVPPLFAMFNMLKSDFLSARYIAFMAFENIAPESGKYSDTLDYANYGIQVSLLELAQRASLDLLDKIAMATTEYLNLHGNPSKINFSNRWFISRIPTEAPRWQPNIDIEIRNGNIPLLAITEVAGDIEEGGYLREKKTIRHSSTHRFTVLHDMYEPSCRKSKYVNHYSYRSFSKQVIETLRLSRAVMFYFVEMVNVHERRLSKDGKTLPLLVPDHDWVRGKS